MNDRYAHLKNLTCSPGADAASIAAAELALGLRLPRDLVDLLHESDGAEGESGLRLYSASELPERNATWETATYAPGYVAIADDGGGRVALVREGDDGPVFASDVGDLQPGGFEQVATSLDAWLRSGCNFSNRQQATGRVRVMLVRMPPGGIRDLMRIRDALSLAVSVPMLRELATRLPAVLVDEIAAHLYVRRVEHLGPLAHALEAVPLD